MATRHATEIEIWRYTDMTIDGLSLFDTRAVRREGWHATVSHSDGIERTYMALTDTSYARAVALCERIHDEWRRKHIWPYAGMPMLGFGYERE
jgi:hypothetical protein